MIRKLIPVLLLPAAMLLSASAAKADDFIWGRVTLIEPNFVLSIGGGNHHEGYRVRYEFGGHHYWTHSRHHPGHFIWVPRPRAPVVHHYYHSPRHDWDHHTWNPPPRWDRHDDQHWHNDHHHKRPDEHHRHNGGVRHPGHHR